MTLPSPSDAYEERITELIWPSGQAMLRFNPSGYESSLYFGKNREFRFDDPERKFGVMYVGNCVPVAFAESFGHDVNDIPPDMRILDEHDLRLRHVFRLESNRALKLADLSGSALPVLGIDATIFTIPDYDLPQRWSARIHGLSAKYDGIYFQSCKLSTEYNLALFERCLAVLSDVDLGNDRAVSGDQDFGCHRLFAASYFYGFGDDLGFKPAIFCLVHAGPVGIEAFDDYVLRVDERHGEAPCDLFVVADDYSGEGGE